MENRKSVVFDMDGTLADFYRVPNWLELLRREDENLYRIAKPMYNTAELNAEIKRLKEKGYRIIVTTWLSRTGTKEFADRIRRAKIEWLDEIEFDYDEIHLVKYGTTKANCTRRHGLPQVLVDDNEKVRKGWKLGKTINANKNILKELRKL